MLSFLQQNSHEAVDFGQSLGGLKDVLERGQAQAVPEVN